MANDRDGVRWWLKLQLDKRSRDKVQREAQDALDKGTDPTKAKRNVGQVEKSFGKLKAAAIALGATLASVWAVRQVVQYSKAIFNLGSSVLAVGNQFDAVFGKHLGKNLRDRTDELRRMAGLTNRQIQEIMAGAGSMGQGFGMAKAASADFAQAIVELSADLASFNNVGTAEAAQLVQSALIGNTEATRSLKVQFTALDVQQRAMEQTGKATAAALTQEEKALAALAVMTERAGPQIGDLNRTQNDSDNAAKQAAGSVRELKESFAALLVEGFAVVPFFQDAKESGEGLTTWISENEENIRGLGTLFGEVASAVLELSGNLISATRNLNDFFRENDRLLTERVADNPLARGIESFMTARGIRSPTLPGDTRPQTEAEAMRADQVQSQIVAAQVRAEQRAAETAEAAAKASAAAARDRAEAEARTTRELKAQAKAAERFAEGLANRDPRLVGGDRWDIGGRRTARERLDRAQEIGAETAGMLPGQVAPLLEREPLQIMEDWQMALQDNWDGISSAGMNAAMGVTGAWQDAFSLLFEEGADLEDFMGELGSGMAAAMLGGLAQFASGKVQENIALALEAVGKGLLNKDPSQFAAAAKFVAASTAWGVLAGGAGAGQGAVAGGGRAGLSGGVPTGARDVGGRIADRQITAPEIHIYIDPLDPHDPAWQDNVGAANQYARERFGDNARITVQPRSRRFA